MASASTGIGRGGYPTRAATNFACAERIGLVDGVASAPVISARIALMTYSAWAMGVPPWLGLGPMGDRRFSSPRPLRNTDHGKKDNSPKQKKTRKAKQRASSAVWPTSSPHT